MFDISDINRVKVIAQEGSFNKAAQKLFISQPALTKRIARLEDTLGMKLFHRSNKGILLTEFGHKITIDGERIAKQMSILERELEMMAGKILGQSAIGLTLVALYAAGGATAASFSGFGSVLSTIGPAKIAVFVPNVLLGFLLFNSMFAAVGSSVMV